MMDDHRARAVRLRRRLLEAASALIRDVQSSPAMQAEASILAETMEAAARLLADGTARAAAERDRIYAEAIKARRPAARATPWAAQRHVTPKRSRGVQ